VSAPGRALAPSWHAASGTIAFTAVRAGGLQQLMLFDLGTRSERPVAAGGLQTFGPTLSPDGATLLFEGFVGTASSDLYLLPVAGGTPAAVGPFAYSNDGGAAWSPDGLTIYFLSDRSGQTEPWRMDRDGTNQAPLATGSSILGRPSVSPDGATLAWARDEAGQQKVVLHTVAGGAERLLSAEPDDDPAVDASGTRLAVRTQRFGVAFQVVILDATSGALVTRVSRDGEVAGAPAFPR
jgi:Tol biopolymer transport system component